MPIDLQPPNFSAPTNCAICNRPQTDGVKMRNSGVIDGLLIECPQCGRYELNGHEAIFESYQWSADLRPALSCAARQASETGQPLKITASNAAEHAEGHARTRTSDNTERLLLQIATLSKRPGG